MSLLHLSFLFIIFSLLVTPASTSHIFNSRNAIAQTVISTCRARLPSEKTQCYPLLRCILDNVPSDFAARWNAGASVLAFIPTIVGLMSNSIMEVSALADESSVLALALSFTSVTSFISRFGDGPFRASGMFGDEQRGGVEGRIQMAVEGLKDRIAKTTTTTASLQWWQGGGGVLITFLSLVAFFLASLIWYEVYEVTKYGIVTFACPVKVNIGIWVGLSHLLCLANLATRSLLFDIRSVRLGARRNAVLPIAHSAAFFPHAPTAANAHGSSPNMLIVLRCPKDTPARWVLQTFSAVASFTLYAYGTVLLASTTLVPASDAIRAMVVMTASAGFGRLVAYWLNGPRRRGRRVLVVDVPAECLAGFESSIIEQF